MKNKRVITVSEGKKERVDIYLKSATGLSRGAAQKLIDAGNVFINSRAVKNYHTKVKGGDVIEFTEDLPEPIELKPADISIEVLHEDQDMLVINKQPGLVVHPAPGHYDDTLVNALIGRYINMDDFRYSRQRPGIVHRLDKDTSGVMVVARTEEMRLKLSALFKKKEIHKVYKCLVHGAVAAEGRLSASIGRDPRDRKKFSTKPACGKEAETIFAPEEEYYGATLLRIRILTGRTHQIRVHMSHIKHEVLGDPVYGDRNKDLQLLTWLGYDKMSLEDILPRQMLHAAELSFINPLSGKEMFFEAPLPADFARVVSMLRTKNKDK